MDISRDPSHNPSSRSPPSRKRSRSPTADKNNDATTTDNSTTTNDHLYQTLEKLLFVLSSEDDEGYFARPINAEANPRYLELVKRPMDFGSMHRKLNARAYASLSEFQDDFDTVMKNAMLFHPPADDVYQLAARLRAFGTRLINSLYARFPPAAGAQAKAAGAKKPARRVFPAQKFALAQRAPDGAFFFTSAVTKPLEEVPLVDDLIRVNIVPNYSEHRTAVPPLKTVAHTRNIMYNPATSHLQRNGAGGSRQSKPNTPATVHFHDYGPFASFAPSYTSANATLSQTETIKLRSRRAGAVVLVPEAGDDDEERGEQDTSSPPPPPLSAAGVKVYRGDEDDVALQQALEELVGDGSSSAAPSSSSAVAAVLEANLDLVAQLEEFQVERFDTGNGGAALSEDEAGIVRRLAENLYTLLDTSSPRAAIASRDSVQAMMRMLHTYAPAYRGTLPATRRHAYATNLAGRAAFPVNAGVAPLGGADEYLPPPPSLPPQTPLSSSRSGRAGTRSSGAAMWK
ncbi:hypothetical protein HDU86_007547 [Geranomyces michiganensis]|nr:hypothetical protein HDU86_007547 [Geranomyces michiganensis]